MILVLALAATQLAPPPTILRPATERRQNEFCPQLTSPSGTELVVIGHYEGAALSTAWIGTQDEETQVVEIQIARGRPLHLVLTPFKKLIYRFRGATRRIRQLSLIGGRPVAATGIARGRVSFAAAPCFRHSHFYRDDLSGAHELVQRVFGRPAQLAGAYTVNRIRIDDEVTIAPVVRRDMSQADEITRTLYHFSPAGIARVNVRRVISNVAVGDYEVLPQAAGVRQLLRNGAIVEAGREDALRWTEQARRRGRTNAQSTFDTGFRGYRIVRPIRVPAGLCGAHRVLFYAPAPDFLRGPTCHARIFFDDGTSGGLSF